VKSVFSFLLLACLTSAFAADDARVTPAVKLIEKVRPGIVPIFCREGNTVGSGAGVLVHHQGYILTADHVTQAREGVVIFGLTRVPYKIIGRLPERDLALLKVDLPSSIAPIRVGRSDDLRIGEPIIVGGNPGGRGLVFSQGTINAPSIDPTWPSLLAQTFFRDDAAEAALAAERKRSTGGRPEFIQFDAMSNKGNSGGALLNFHGDLIGIVVQKSTKEEAINWAIPVDRIRLWLPSFLQPEEVGGFWTGLTLDPLAADARITTLAPSSPAAQVDLQVGDVIQSVEGKPVRSALDWLVALVGREKGKSIKLTVQRQSTTLEKTLALGDYPGVATSADGKRPGVNYTLYRGRYRIDTGVKDLTSLERGELTTTTLDGLKARPKEDFSVVYEGYVEFPEAGLHRLWLGSDDGARLYLDNRLIIDNGLSHPYQELSHAIRVPKGLVPIRIEYYQGTGETKLSVTLRRGNVADTAPAMDLQLWRDAEEPRAK